jgi:hypothetical protein
LVSAAVALVLCAGGLSAGEYKGKVKSVDTTKSTITIATKDGDKTFTVAKDAKFTGGKKIAEQLAAEGLKHEVFTKTGKKAAHVTLTTTGEGDKEEVTAVKVGGGKKKGKKNSDS